MEQAYSPRSCVVLTTPERFNLFSSVLGDEVDAHFDPERTRPLAQLLDAVALSGGKTVVLDEAHFYSIDDMIEGLDSYLDSAMSAEYPLRFIVVCSRRKADDSLLAHIALYDGIYELVFDAQGAEVSARIAHFLSGRGRRSDIQEIFFEQKKLIKRNNAYRTL